MKFCIILIICTNFIQYIGSKELKTSGKKDQNVSNTEKWKKLIENKERYGGDMLGLEPQQPGVLRKASSANHRLWPNGTVIYKFANNVFNSNERQFIESVMRDIEDLSCIRFKERIKQKDYINIIRGDGCYSYVGRIGNRQDVSLGIGCLYRGTVIHELMHAMGFYHEHMRSDRDSFLVIHLNHVMPGMKDNFEKNPGYMNRLLTKFDYNSIMIYSSTAFSRNGLKTMEPKDKHYTLREPYDKKQMTNLDAISINRMYNCPSN